MATRLTWLKDVQARELRLLARAIGASCSGTKVALRDQIESTLASPFFQPWETQATVKKRGRSGATRTNAKNGFQPSSLISIDMGVKNLAYCHIHPPTTSRPQALLSDWQRVDVLSAIESNDGNKYAYHPSIFSQAAYSTISRLLAHAQPNTHFVIERQRFRSMGGKGVFEWTLKVNMLEGMLWAVLATMRERGSWKGEVMGVRAESVDGFWGEGEGQLDAATKPKVVEKRKSLVEGEEGADAPGTSGRGRKKNSGEKKKGTIEMVKGWLKEGKLSTEGEATQTMELYLGKKKTKLDDLADCVAQGMAVLKWGQNQQEILTKDAEKIKLEWKL